jgi:Leucine-rich repeat (LRR) protein
MYSRYKEKQTGFFQALQRWRCVHDPAKPMRHTGRKDGDGGSLRKRIRKMTKPPWFMAIPITLISLAVSSYALNRSTDSMALLAIRITNPSAQWGDTRQTIDKWYGVGIKNDRVDSLNFSRVKISIIPQEITYLSELTYLNLWTETGVDSLPPEIGTLSKLKTLLVSSVRSIPPEIGNLSNLNKLQMYYSRCPQLPSEIGNCTALKVLTLAYCSNLEKLPTTIGNCVNLDSLEISAYLAGQSKLASIPPEIGKLKDLSFLCIARHTLLTSLPGEITGCSKLRILDVQGNKLQSLPEQLGSLINLEALTVQNNALSAVPSSIGSLVKLTTLDMGNNGVTLLPDGIGNLTQLRSLSLHHNKLLELPSTIGTCTALTTVELNDNQLSSLPSTIGNLANVVEIELKNNQLTSLPAGIGNLTKITSLDLSRNQLSSIPSGIGGLSGSLSYLNICYNKLTSLPPAIGSCVSLTMIMLDSNLLSAIPPEIGKCTNLVRLSCSNNNITSLPPEIGNLKAIVSINLNNNQIAALPPSMNQLFKLRSLRLRNNQIASIPVELCVKQFMVDSLDLNSNRLATLPHEIIALTPWGDLDMGSNYLTITDTAVISWLNMNDGDWKSTQRNSGVLSYKKIPGQATALSIAGHKIDFTLPSDSRYKIDLISPHGRTLMTVAEGMGTAGRHSCKLPYYPATGCFFVRLSTMGETAVTRGTNDFKN